MAREREWGRFDRGRARAAARPGDAPVGAIARSWRSSCRRSRRRWRSRARWPRPRATGGDATTAARRARADPEGEPQAPAFRASIAPPAVSLIAQTDIQAAWLERRERAGSAERHIRELTLRGEVALETSGLARRRRQRAVSVFSAGDVEFGQPMRITAVVGIGREGIIDVEREAQLGGSIHTKGVAILRGYLARMFGQERPAQPARAARLRAELRRDRRRQRQLERAVRRAQRARRRRHRPGRRRDRQREPARRDAGHRRRVREDRGLLRPLQGARADRRAGRARARARTCRTWCCATTSPTRSRAASSTCTPSRRPRRASRSSPGCRRASATRAGASRRRASSAGSSGASSRWPSGSARPRATGATRSPSRSTRSGRATHRRGQRAHPRPAVRQGARRRGRAHATIADAMTRATRRVLAVGCLLLSSGCAGGPLVERAYDGHVVEGRAIEPEAYAAFLTGAMAESSGRWARRAAGLRARRAAGLARPGDLDARGGGALQPAPGRSQGRRRVRAGARDRRTLRRRLGGQGPVRGRAQRRCRDAVGCAPRRRARPLGRRRERSPVARRPDRGGRGDARRPDRAHGDGPRPGRRLGRARLVGRVAR